MEELALAFPERKIVYEQQGEGEVVADPDCVAQLPSNSIGNAMTYRTQSGTVTVPSSIDAEVVALSVHNTGEPIPEGKIDTFFEPLVRGVPCVSGMRSVGLGLYIVKALAAAHQGRATFSSTEEGGTIFTFLCRRARTEHRQND